MSSADHPPCSTPSGPSPVPCWECDTPTVDPINAPLPLPSGNSVTITLCKDCFETRYVTLLRELAADPLATHRRRG